MPVKRKRVVRKNKVQLGAGFFSSIGRFVKKAVNKTVDAVKKGADVVKKVKRSGIVGQVAALSGNPGAAAAASQAGFGGMRGRGAARSNHVKLR